MCLCVCERERDSLSSVGLKNAKVFKQGPPLGFEGDSWHGFLSGKTKNDNEWEGQRERKEEKGE